MTWNETNSPVGGLFHHNSKTMWYFTYKAASTSTREMLKAAKFVDERIGYRDSDEYFKFGNVRNPWMRTVACYELVKKCHATIGKKFHDFAIQNEIGLTFPIFVDHMMDDDLKNIHWTPFSITLPESIDFVGRTEAFQQDWDELVRLRPIIPGGTKFTTPYGLKYDRGNIRKYYTDELVQLVESYYKDDIERFEYSFDMVP